MWAGQTWLQLTQEAVYGTFNAAGLKVYPRLYVGNSFTPRRAVQRQVIRTADAGNRRIQVVANRQQFTGTLKTLFYPTQAATLLAWASTLTANDLPSFTADYWDSVQAQRFLGGKVKSLRIMSSAQQDYATLEFDMIFQKRDDTFVAFTQPLQSVYPTENPYQHINTKTNVTLGGTAVALYKDINITINNVLFPTWDEDIVITSLLYCGRDLDFAFTPQYVNNTYRAAFEAQTPLTWVVKWANAVPHSVTITAEGSGYIASVADDLPLDGAGYAAISNEIFFDKTATTDFAVAVV
jgi:hypothetical protein